MTARHLTISWIISIFGFLAFLVFVVHLGNEPTVHIPSTNLETFDTAVIGSSLTQAAIPDSALFYDNRPHKMLIVWQINEATTLALLDYAVRVGVSTIIVEANDFVYDTVDRNWQQRVSSFATGLAAQFRRGIKLLKRIRITDMTFREGDIPRNTNILEAGKTNFRLKVKFIVKKDRNTILANVIRRAKQKSIDVVLFLPPFSQLYTNALKGDVESFNVRADALAGSLGVRFWRASAPWENNLFRDEAHLNIWGRERFMREFRHWLRSAP